MSSAEETHSIQAQEGDKKSTLRRTRWWRYGPVVIWMALIFIGSGNLLSGSNTSFFVRLANWLLPAADAETLAFLHLLVRKIAHLTEYAILAMLAARAWRTSSLTFLRRHWFATSWLLVTGYALSDEFHQSFVPTRGASIYDCLIDSLGGLIGLLMVWWWRQRVDRRESQPARAIKAGAAI